MKPQLRSLLSRRRRFKGLHHPRDYVVKGTGGFSRGTGGRWGRGHLPLPLLPCLESEAALQMPEPRGTRVLPSAGRRRMA
ncbi:hypothetical protein OPV22_017566 [Ensete ventricosum]|uniref:Uncharacterized protein n=1 Tax=Ensete ventricosum TaxID=4639 RepID=A0AAV8PF28_ENSVE|nr:hypothetical protein OPV22_017566 [Ensete ventricosum]